MRELSISRVVPVLVLAALGGGCDDSTGAGGGGGNTPTTTTGSGTTTSTTSATSSSSGMSNPCDPKASCTAVDKSCLGLVDNAGKTQFGLRMSSIAYEKPVALTKGVVAATFGASVTPALPTCNVQGAATFSWLLQFDTTAGTLKTGGAKPAQDPTKGYAFVDEVVSGLHIAPGILQVKPDASGNFGSALGVDLLMPLYLDAQASQVVLLPLQEARIDMATLSSSQNCIGAYNAAGLDPMNQCVGDDTHPAFIDGGSLAAHILLEDADTVVINLLQETLCVLLSGDAATYGEKDINNITRCKRTGGVIDFKGDWCDMTDNAASPSCADSVDFRADFSASSVLITN